MKIGEVSKRTGVSQRMLRYYEVEGLLKPQRKESSYRDYDVSDIGLINRIIALQKGGLTLDAVKLILPCLKDKPEMLEYCDDLLAILNLQLKKIDARIKLLKNNRKILTDYIALAENDRKNNIELFKG